MPNIEPGQIYLDNDKRSTYARRIKVLDVNSKPGKAKCSTCNSNGSLIGNTLWIKFERLANKRLYTRIL